MGWPGEQVLIRLIDLVERLGAGALEPYQIERVGRASAEARAKERLVLEQAELDAAALRSGRKILGPGGRRTLITRGRTNLRTRDVVVSRGASPTLEFSEAARNRALGDEVQKAVNLRKIVLFAEEEAEEIDRENKVQAESQSYKAVDDDWFEKWKSGARDVSREDMQRIWAKVLVREVESPGRYSIRAINSLSLMSATDASLISRIASFSLSGAIIKMDNNPLTKFGVTFAELAYLEDIGVTSGLGATGVTISPGYYEIGDRRVFSLFCNDTALVIDVGPSKDDVRRLRVPVISVTDVGMQIMSLGSFRANDEYLQDVANFFVKRGAIKVVKGFTKKGSQQLYGAHTIAEKADPLS